MMRGRKQERIEAVVDRAAAVALACAVAFGLLELCRGVLGRHYAVIIPMSAAAITYLLAARMLGAVSPERLRFDLPDFSIHALEVEEADELLLTEQVELVLTDAEMLAPAPAAGDELVLDDILTQLEPQSRVVRLFDPAAMPTPGQLNARIEWHLQGSRPPTPAPASPDASEALFQALSELRRSLR